MNDHAENFAKAEMLIRKPIAEVFEAFINPAITTRFWFTKSSGRVETGKDLEWTWEMYNYKAPVKVLAVEPNKQIVIGWGNRDEATRVEWTFQSLEAGTFVSIINSGFKGSQEQVVAQVRDSTEGFTLVLAGLKALLEHAIQLNLVGDRFPQGLT
ncbi:SRPBCC family protein [Terrimonas pollutisoli]|uniref:SRPBCC family protein n=1 Tax=Terrimonas pollutisoli TaxID=3034147 RepID=UPI0023EAD705|nr:SRPBCC family protein [Terrimonas sp. H1YJ31]